MRSRTVAALTAALSLCGCDLTSPAEPGALVPPTTDQDPSLPQVAITVAHRTRSIHLRTFGSASNPALFVLHGSASDYRPYLGLQALADRYFVVVWDQRGSGLSERITEDEITWDAAVEEIDEVKRRFSPTAPVTLVAHSWGGAYAALYMSRRPANVRQAALVEPGPALNGDIFRATKGELFSLNLAEKVYNDLAWNGEFLSARHHEEMDYKYLMQLKGTMVNHFCDKDDLPPWPVWRVGAYVEYVRQRRVVKDLDFDFAEGLRSFPRPVLLIGSECGALGYGFQSTHHQPLFGSAEVVRIARAGHRLFTEQPEAVLVALRGYLLEYR